MIISSLYLCVFFLVKLLFEGLAKKFNFSFHIIRSDPNPFIFVRPRSGQAWAVSVTLHRFTETLLTVMRFLIFSSVTASSFMLLEWFSHWNININSQSDMTKTFSRIRSIVRLLKHLLYRYLNFNVHPEWLSPYPDPTFQVVWIRIRILVNQA